MKELSWEEAFSKKEAKALVQEIEDMGMEAVPMFNHLGHASASRVMSGKHVVLDQNPRLATLFSYDGWSWNIDNDKTEILLSKIRHELYDIFRNSTYFHLGCDEVYSYEQNDNFQARMSQYLGRITRAVREEGKRPIIWGDMLLNQDACGVSQEYYCGNENASYASAIMQELDHSTLIADWQYDVKKAPVYTSLYFKEKGFEVLGAPWYDPNNCLAHVETICKNELKGILVTTWHTLNQKMPQILEAAKICGAYDMPSAGKARGNLSAETAALLRKVFFTEGNYEESGWMHHQVSQP